METTYELTVIGGGPGGYLAALRAASLGLRTALVEKSELGGTCLNHGCIPTKVMTHAAGFRRRLGTAEDFGFSIREVDFSFARLQEKKRAVVGELTGHVGELLKGAGVELYRGEGTLPARGEVAVTLASGEQCSFSTNKVIIATGSEEIYPPIPGLDLPGVITAWEALSLEELPASLAVIGGGVIALEMASIFSALGTDVSIVHRSERLLRRMDLEMVRRLATYLRKGGLKVSMNTPVQGVETGEKGLRLTVAGKKGDEFLDVEKVLLSVGRQPAYGGLDLAGLGVTLDSGGGIKVNSRMETSVPGIYAVGDVTAPGYFLAHAAYHQGLVAAENAAGDDSHFDGTVCPACLFTDPELACVGLSEEDARDQGLAELSVGKFPFSACGKAATQGESEGTVKIICAGREQRVVGLHILGPHASDLIQEGALAVSRGVTAADLAALIHPHPTLSEAVWEAAMAVHKVPLHLTRR